MRKVLIHQKPDGWQVTNVHYGTCRLHKTAFHALKAVKRECKQYAESHGGIDVTQIEWFPLTEAGLIIAKVLKGTS